MEQVTLDWFTTQEVSRKRKIIAKTIESLSATESSLLLPQIPFEATAASTRSKSRKPVYNDFITDDEEEEAFKDETFIVAASGFYVLTQEWKVEVATSLNILSTSRTPADSCTFIHQQVRVV